MPTIILFNKKRLTERLYNREVSKAVPMPDDVKEVFGNLFESESPADSVPIHQPLIENGDEYIDSRKQTVQPIMEEEVL